MKKTDVTALGEILIDMTYAGKSENGQTLFEQNPGGAPANVLAALSRLGKKTAFIGKVGKDMHGTFLRETIKKYGIDDSNLITTDEAFTTLAFVSLSESGERSFSFARNPGADIMLKESEVNRDLIKNSSVFHFGSLSLTHEPARTATFSALKCAKENHVIVSYDPNYRAMLWESEEKAMHGMRSPLAFVDIIKISDEETELVTGKKSPEEAIDCLLNEGISCVIVTMGAKGAMVGINEGKVFKEAVPGTKVVDTTGAGDAFMGGFLYKLCENHLHPENLTLENISEFCEFANKVASRCVEKRGGINAMPTIAELDA